MGNALFGFGKKRRSSKGAVVHPVVGHEGGAVRIKVRMSRGQLKDLIEKVDMSRGNSESELGRLIVEECSKGRLHPALIVAADHGEWDSSQEGANRYAARGWGLRPIQEHTEEL